MHIQHSPVNNPNLFEANTNRSNRGSFQAQNQGSQNTPFAGIMGQNSNATLTVLILSLIQALLQSFSQPSNQQASTDDHPDSAMNMMDDTSDNSMSNMDTLSDDGMNTTEDSADDMMHSMDAMPDNAMSTMDDMSSSDIDNTSSVSSKQVFNTPTGATEPGPALPGNSYETTFTAEPGEKLSFATMFVQSNDLFFSPDENGIPLFDHAGQPLQGDVTDFVSLWDAGTELNEPAGSGENQPVRQSGPNTGDSDPDNHVRKFYDANNELPAVNELIKAEIEYMGDNQFTLKISNISGSSALASPIAPGVAVVHSEPAPIFDSLEADRGLGLEALAEDGDPSVLIDQIGK